MPAVKIARRRLHRQVNQSESLVNGDLSPHTGVAGIFRRTFLPRVVAKLALLRNGMENPEPLAGADIEATDVSLVVAHALGSHAFAKSSADDHRVFGHHRRGLDANFAGNQIRENVLIGIHLQIHFAVISKRRNSNACLGVQTNEPKPRCHIQDSLFFAVGPIGQPAAGKLPGSGAAAFSLTLAVDPQQLTGGRV